MIFAWNLNAKIILLTTCFAFVRRVWRSVLVLQETHGACHGHNADMLGVVEGGLLVGVWGKASDTRQPERTRAVLQLDTTAMAATA